MARADIFTLPGDTVMQIQYVGFQLKAHGRDYTYRVIDKQAEDREFIFSISNRALWRKQLPFQDAAALCYQKLQKALDSRLPRTLCRGARLFRPRTRCLPRVTPPRA